MERKNLPRVSTQKCGSRGGQIRIVMLDAVIPFTIKYGSRSAAPADRLSPEKFFLESVKFLRLPGGAMICDKGKREGVLLFSLFGMKNVVDGATRL